MIWMRQSLIKMPRAKRPHENGARQSRNVQFGSIVLKYADKPLPVSDGHDPLSDAREGGGSWSHLAKRIGPW